MPDQNVQNPSGGSAPSQEKQEPKEPRYDAAYFVEHARALLGVSGPVVFGALSGDRRKTFTVADAKKLVKDHLKRPQES